MKIIQVIALLYLISFTYQDCSDYSQKDDCKSNNLSQDEKDEGAEYCCFKKDAYSSVYKDGHCKPLTKYQYKHIKDYIKTDLLAGSHEDTSIDCKSFYLEISLISLLLFLF